jgi:uncharacterized metal-binding protein YceD (DUF177 family)
MCSLEQFKIDLKAVTDGETPFQYELDNQFFAALDDAEIQEGSLHVSGSIRKTTGFYEFQLCISGTVQIPCDRCLDMMAQPIEADLTATVKLGTSTQDTDDDIIWVNERDGLLDIAWPIYESIVLAVPIQHVHQPGDCNVLMSEKLNELWAARSSGADAQQTIDPRWQALAKLKSNL